MLGDGCGLVADSVLLSKIAMWAQGSGQIRQKYGVFLPQHPWEDLEGIPSLGTDIKLGSMQRAALNVVAGKLKIKSPASQLLRSSRMGYCVHMHGNGRNTKKM